MMKKRVYFILKIFLISSLVLFFSSSIASSRWFASDPRLVYSSGINCEKSEKTANWLNISITGSGTIVVLNNISIFNSSGNVGNCSLFGPPDYYGSFCCPEGYYCNSSTGKCLPRPKNYCEGLNRLNCEGPNSILFGTLTFIELKVPGWDDCGEERVINESCTRKYFCECYWKADSSECFFRMRTNETCFQLLPPYNPIGSFSERCEYFIESKEDRCASQGKIFVKFGATKHPPTASIICNGFTREYPCSTLVNLPFFNMINLLFSFLFLGVIYFFVQRKRFLRR